MQIKLPTVLVTSRSFGSGRVDYERSLVAAGFQVIRAASNHSDPRVWDVLPEVDAWIAGTSPIGPGHIQRAQRLKIVARYGTGIDSIDLEAAARRDVVVTNTPGANARSVAEHAAGLILGSLRRVTANDTAVRRGDWGASRVRALAGLTVGVVGLGRIGTALVERLRGFDCHFVGFDPHAPISGRLDGVQAVSIDEMARVADVVSLHAPGGAPIITEEWLRRSGHPVSIVNTARADLVDEVAIVRGLETGRVATYAADTMQHESADTSASPLCDVRFADRVLLSPHNASQTDDAIDAMGRMASESILDYFAGREPSNVVRASEGRSLA